MARPKRFKLTDDERGMLSELLRIAQSALLECASDIEQVMPRTQCAERMRLLAECAADLRERIEASE